MSGNTRLSRAAKSLAQDVMLAGFFNEKYQHTAEDMAAVLEAGLRELIAEEEARRLLSPLMDDLRAGAVTVGKFMDGQPEQ